MNREQLVVEEARRTRAREDVRGLHPFDVLPRPRHLVHALVGREPVALVVREVVDDRVPDRARELQEVRVVGAEGLQRARIAGAGVVLVEQAGRAVGEHQAGVAERPVGGRGHREDRDLEAVEVEGLAVLRLDEVPEAEGLELAAQERRGEVREQHPRALVDVAGEERGVEVVAVEVRHVQEVGPGERPRVEAIVAGKWEP